MAITFATGFLIKTRNRDNIVVIYKSNVIKGKKSLTWRGFCMTLHTNFIIFKHVALTSYGVELFQIILPTLGHPMLVTLIFKFAASSALFETIDALAIEFWLHYIPNNRHGELGPFWIL